MELQEVRYGRKLKRVSLQRYIVSKIVYEPHLITDQDLIVLFDNQIWLEGKCLKDHDFNKKFGKTLEVISILLKEVNLSKGLSPKALIRLSSRIRTRTDEFQVPARNYASYKARFSGLFSIVPAKQPGVPKKFLPPKKVIGLGYRDKGTMRDPGKDGSPSWQEVASRAGQLALVKRRVKDAKQFGQIKSALIDFFES